MTQEEKLQKKVQHTRKQVEKVLIANGMQLTPQCTMVPASLLTRIIIKLLGRFMKMRIEQEVQITPRA